MATCGYLCPACEGRGYDEQGETCTWCAVKDTGLKSDKKDELTDEEWINRVHGKNCCSDLGEED